MSDTGTSTENIFRLEALSAIYSDPGIDEVSADNLVFLVIAATDEFVCGLTDRKSGKLLAIERISMESFHQNWNDYFDYVRIKSKLWSNYPAASTSISVSSTDFTLIPSALFKEGDENRYYQLNLSAPSDSLIRHQHISKYAIEIVYGLEKNFNEAVQHHFINPVFIHHSHALLESMSMLMRTDQEKTAWLNVRINIIDLVISEGKKILLCNSFRWTTIEDVLYFVLFVYEQLELNPENTSLLLSGKITTESGLHDLLGRYIKNLKYIRKIGSMRDGFITQTVRFNDFPSLFSLALCE